MNKKIFPIGIGTWGIGGFVEKNTTNDQRSIKSLNYCFSRGMNFIEVNYWAAEGHSVELIAEAFKESNLDKDEFFINQALYAYKNETLEDVKNEMRIVRQLLGIKCVDSIEFDITGINKYGLENVILFCKKALVNKETKYISLTNSNLEMLKKFKETFGEKMFCHELNFNFEIRENEDLGIIEFTNQNKIKNVVYQPLRRNRTANRKWPLLCELAEKYGKTQNQIIINWLVSRDFLPLIKSSNLKHIDENIAALDFNIEEVDIKRLNSFRPINWNTPKLVWDNQEVSGKNVAIHQLSNIFDEMYDKKLQ